MKYRYRTLQTSYRFESCPDRMSKRRIGWYEDGSIKHSYFRRRKHHRTKRNGFCRIRWKMYVAKAIKLDKAFDRLSG